MFALDSRHTRNKKSKSNYTGEDSRQKDFTKNGQDQKKTQTKYQLPMMISGQDMMYIMSTPFSL